MPTISSTISLGDIVVLVTLAGSVIGLYFTVVRRVDRLEYIVGELRHGRGLVLDHFPYLVRRCFGYEKPDVNG